MLSILDDLIWSTKEIRSHDGCHLVGRGVELPGRTPLRTTTTIVTNK